MNRLQSLVGRLVGIYPNSQACGEPQNLSKYIHPEASTEIDSNQSVKLMLSKDFVKYQFKERPLRSTLIALFTLSLLLVLGGLLFKFVPAVKSFTPIATAIEHIPAINGFNGYAPLIVTVVISTLLVAGLVDDHFVKSLQQINEED